MITRIVRSIPIVLLASCSIGIGQTPSAEEKKEAEFKALLQKAADARKATALMIKAADEKTTDVVTKTSTKIVTLKEEVHELKVDLNEANSTPLIIDLGVDFELLPIGSVKENR